MKVRALVFAVCLALGLGTVPVYEWWNRPIEPSLLGQQILDSIETEEGWSLTRDGSGIVHAKAGVLIVPRSSIAITHELMAIDGHPLHGYTDNDKQLIVRASRPLHKKLQFARFK